MSQHTQFDTTQLKTAKMPVNLIVDSTISKLEEVSPEIGPIEQKMRATLKSLKGSKYPDTFDWSTYDKISARFGDDQPRGGVVFNTTLKLVNHHATCTKCLYSFELDTYGRGCMHNCHYCYAKETLYAHKYWNEPIPFPVNLAEIRKIFYTVFETNRPSKWREIMEKRIPIRLGSMSDSFQWMDRKYKITQELLKILKFYNYPYVVFTRSDLIAEDEYLNLLDPKLSAVQFSISGGNEKLTKAIEPGAPTVERRLQALSTLSKEKIWTTVRINPLFPIYPDGYFTDPFATAQRFGGREKVPKFDLFDWDFIEQLADAKVPSLLAGFVRLSPWSVNNLTRATGIDFKSFFLPENAKGNFDRRYTEKEIAYYYKQIKDRCDVEGIRFSTCYIGNGIKDYFQYQNLWNNKSDCCDVIGNVDSFKSSAQEISWDERLRHTSCKPAALEAMKMDIEYSESQKSSIKKSQKPSKRDHHAEI